VVGAAYGRREVMAIMQQAAVCSGRVAVTLASEVKGEV
jgi:hypothetical protein